MMLHAIIILTLCIIVNTHYSLYYTNLRRASYPIFDCLYAYIIVDNKEDIGEYIRNYHLTPYCRRPDQDQEISTEDIRDNTKSNAISFNQLFKLDISSEQLLRWSAPIAVAERYEMNPTTSEIFYNCSLPWFGSKCQYKFPHESLSSFGDIVKNIFLQRDYIEPSSNLTTGTCYRFLENCNSKLWPLCLDWREVCDGKVDCKDAEDEQGCEQLETSTCADNEYRCHFGGQCISEAFNHDNRYSTDCLDGSDEMEFHSFYMGSFNPQCKMISTFTCEERIGRFPRSFQCGNGAYIRETFLPTYDHVCQNRKGTEISRLLLTSLDHIPELSCQQAFYCAFFYKRNFGTSGPPIGAQSVIVEGIWDRDCKNLSEHCSSPWLVIPKEPTMFGIFQLVYLTNRSITEFEMNVAPDYICFKKETCLGLLSDLVIVEIVPGLICFHISNLTDIGNAQNLNQLSSPLSHLALKCRTTGIQQSCNNSLYFHCNRSLRCIPYHRVGDSYMDCFFGEDETFEACQLNDSKRYKCNPASSICLSPVAVGNGLPQCSFGEDEVFVYTNNLVELVPYMDLCDIVPASSIHSLRANETDETNCEWWPCDNAYTHCNQLWDCPNGADEFGCSDMTCSSNEHQCTNQHLGTVYCLPITHMFDRYINDCSDLYYYRQLYFDNETSNTGDYYYSWNSSKCIEADKICRYHSQTVVPQDEVCLQQPGLPNLFSTEDVRHIKNEEYLCTISNEPKRNRLNQFLTTARLGNFPDVITETSRLFQLKTDHQSNISFNIDPTSAFYCNQGILVLTGENETKQCLCPPSYFGDRCQWQNQRVSLTLQFLPRLRADFTVIFQAIIMLIDEQGFIIGNHEQITYMPSRDCTTKFNIYLLYPTRPKNASMNYSIRIDIFHKITLEYWTSWHLPIPFSFLPVNRIATQLHIYDKQVIKKCSLLCGNYGRCMTYLNNQSFFFCQCQSGYSGPLCDKKQECSCSNDSFCLTSSICVCPLYKFGSKCYLKHSICQSNKNPCENNGLCIPTDDRISLQKFTCICPEGYSGERCQNRYGHITINLDKTITKNTSFLLIHFITAFQNSRHEQTATFKKIPFDQNLIRITITQSFNILLIQIPNENYYLAVLRETFMPSENISTYVLPKQRCSPIEELLNQTFLRYDYLHRAKYYPLLCRQYSQLRCFHDKDHMCICDLDRFANCFLFHHEISSNPQEYNDCQNDAQAFFNNQTCPTKWLCICNDCFYGSKCQFSTESFILSLDPIIGYHIQPNVQFGRQPSIIKISLAINLILFVIGFVNGLFSIITFSRKKSREIGSGYYMLVSSISSLCMIIILMMKFIYLILSQMLLLTNQKFLKFNCVLLDFLLNICLASSEWLNAFVAIERLVYIREKTHFNKKKSIEVSKLVIMILFSFTISTNIHDPINRQLIDDFDGDEKRTWCFTQYSSNLNIYNLCLHIFHFFAPLLINVICSTAIIIKLIRILTYLRTRVPSLENLRNEVRLHVYYLSAPFMLILLTLPRLIISFMEQCMRSPRTPWVFLIGYYVSFIPSILTFVIFVLPSKTYKREFNNYVRMLIKRLHRTE